MKNVIVNKALHQFLVISCSALLFFSCSGEKRETLTSGSLTMSTSEELFPVIDIQVKDFQRIYEETNITHHALSTREAFVQLLNDSVKLIICARQLNDEERSVAVSNELEIDSLRIAYDGIAVVVNEKNGLKQLTTDELRNIVTGETERWSSFSASGLSSAIVLAMGDPNSGVYEFLKTRIAAGRDMSSALIPYTTTPEIFAMVQERPNAIGFVGTAWLSRLPKGMRTVNIGDPAFRRDTTSRELEFFEPHQAYIYQRFYPLTRDVYIFTQNVGKGVGRGFSSFSAGPDGQKIIVSNGLVPATMPVRLVQLQSP